MVCYILSSHPAFMEKKVYSVSKDDILNMFYPKWLELPYFLTITFKGKGEERKGSARIKEFQPVEVEELYEALLSSEKFVRISNPEDVEEYISKAYFAPHPSYVVTPKFITTERFVNIHSAEGVVRARIPIVLTEGATIKKEYYDRVRKQLRTMSRPYYMRCAVSSKGSLSIKDILGGRVLKSGEYFLIAIKLW